MIRKDDRPTEEIVNQTESFIGRLEGSKGYFGSNTLYFTRTIKENLRILTERFYDGFKLKAMLKEYNERRPAELK